MFERTPDERLGMPNATCGPIRSHAFFKSIAWDKLERRELPPPFRPKVVRPKQHNSCCTLVVLQSIHCLVFLCFQRDASDTGNFDTDFTMERAMLTPTDKEFLKTMDPHAFRGFSFTNPDML